MKHKNNKSKQSIRLREKELNNGDISLYLDIYYNGKRTYEFLKLYIVKAKTPLVRISNKETYKLAESIRAKRQLEFQNGTYGFTSEFKQNTNFIEYFKKLTEERKASTGNYGNWDSTLKHIENFCKADTTFKDIDDDFVKRFKDYLLSEPLTKSNIKLSQNSAHSYFNKFRACIKQAYEDKIIPDNPTKRVKGIKQAKTHREYLTLDELKKIVKAECKYPVLKRAFLFSCLTGLRWSDIQKLTWSEVQKFNDGYRIIFQQKKTNELQYLDISQQARNLFGEAKEPDEKVFTGLKYSAYHNLELKRWTMRAGINKHITFHSGRHTFAIIQIDLGTDIYTLSKLLGHSILETTQIYSDVLDTKRKEAMNKIPDININL